MTAPARRRPQFHPLTVARVEKLTDDEGAPSVSGIGPAARAAARPGGAMPASASLRRPASLIQSVLQAGENTVRTSTRAYPAPVSAAPMSWRISSMAGQPE